MSMGPSLPSLAQAVAIQSLDRPKNGLRLTIGEIQLDRQFLEKLRLSGQHLSIGMKLGAAAGVTLSGSVKTRTATVEPSLRPPATAKQTIRSLPSRYAVAL